MPLDENFCETHQCYSTANWDVNAADPLTKAQAFATDVRSDVLTQFDFVKGSILGGDDASIDILGRFSTVLDSLESFDFPLIYPSTEMPDVDWNIDVDFDLPKVVPSDFGKISDWSLGQAPKPDPFPGVDDVDIPKFVPSIGSITIPGAPEERLIPEPGDAPDAPIFIYPKSPDITLPDRPQLQQVTLPPAPTIELPDLGELTFPEIENMNIDTFINWSEPAYSPEIWTDVKAQIQRFFAGGSGIRPEVEEAMVARGRDREDRLIRQQEAQATDEWAGRGFTAPPGMLVKRLDNIREEGMIKKLGLNREVLIKAMDEELANIRLGVQQGIVAEQLFVQIHLAAIERLFLIQRLHVEWEIQKYNLLVDVYKAKWQENLIRAQVYEIQVRAALAEIDIFKALVEAEMVKAEINKTLIQSYTAEIQAREAFVDLYKARVEAIKVHADIFETEVRAYGEGVRAYAAQVDADKTRFEVFATKVQAESAKVGIIEAEARAYQAQIGGIEAGVRAQTAVLEGAIAEYRAEIDAYEAGLRSLVAKNQVELSSIQANVAGYQADTQRFIAATGAEEAKSRVEIAAWETENRYNLAWFETKMKEFELLINQMIAQKNAMLEAIKSAGELTSTIAAGGLAALHASASISGSGGLSGSGTDSRAYNNATNTNFGCNTNTNTNIDVTQNTIPNIPCVF